VLSVEGWHPTKASKALYELTGTTKVFWLVSTYQDVRLYACALHWDIPSRVTLPENIDAVAFALADVCAGPAGDLEIRRELLNSNIFRVLEA